MSRSALLEVIISLLVLLFVYAGAVKLLDFDKFAVQLGQSPMLTHISGFVAVLVPASEFLISTMLISTRWRLLGLYASLTLMVMFTTYIVSILQFSDYIPCSCGGILEKLGWREHLVFNIFFVLISLVGILVYGSQHQKKFNRPNLSNQQ